MSQYVFVYGTLQQGRDNDKWMHWSRGQYLCDAWVSEIDLYLLPQGFPAAVRGNGVAHGEIWTVSTLKWLDKLEGNGSHYRRVRMNFETRTGPVDGWIYLYLPRLSYAMPLVNGIYPGSEDVMNLLYEWATYKGWPTPYDLNGFDVYEKDDSNCWMICDDCPYQKSCIYSDSKLDKTSVDGILV